LALLEAVFRAAGRFAAFFVLFLAAVFFLVAIACLPL
jgi:hypothetical protein